MCDYLSFLSVLCLTLGGLLYFCDMSGSVPLGSVAVCPWLLSGSQAISRPFFAWPRDSNRSCTRFRVCGVQYGCWLSSYIQEVCGCRSWSTASFRFLRPAVKPIERIVCKNANVRTRALSLDGECLARTDHVQTTYSGHADVDKPPANFDSLGRCGANQRCELLLV